MLDRLSRFPRFVVLALALALVGLVGWLERVIGAEISVSIFFLIPISLVAWCHGRKPALLFSFLCAGLWLAVDVANKDTISNWFVEYWNAGVHLGFFVIVGLSICVVRKALLREQQLSRVDRLTGLWNSRHFLETLEAEVERSRRYGHTFCLAYLDLDNFKSINDSQGHREGCGR